MRHKIDLDLCRAALEKLAKEPTCYENLRKHIIRVTACGSPGKVNRVIKDLVVNEWIEKMGPRGTKTPYRISERGKAFLRGL